MTSTSTRLAILFATGLGAALAASAAAAQTPVSATTDWNVSRLKTGEYYAITRSFNNTAPTEQPGNFAVICPAPDRWIFSTGDLKDGMAPQSARVQCIGDGTAPGFDCRAEKATEGAILECDRQAVRAWFAQCDGARRVREARVTLQGGGTQSFMIRYQPLKDTLNDIAKRCGASDPKPAKPAAAPAKKTP